MFHAVDAGEHRHERRRDAHDRGDRQVELPDDERDQGGHREEDQHLLAAEDRRERAPRAERVGHQDEVDERHRGPDEHQRVLAGDRVQPGGLEPAAQGDPSSAARTARLGSPAVAEDALGDAGRRSLSRSAALLVVFSVMGVSSGRWTLTRSRWRRRTSSGSCVRISSRAPSRPLDEDAVADLGEVGGLDADEQHPDPARRPSRDGAQDVDPGADVDGLGRLVEHEQVGLDGQPLGEQHLLLVAAADSSLTSVVRRAGPDGEPVDRGPRPRRPASGGRRTRAAPGGGCWAARCCRGCSARRRARRGSRRLRHQGDAGAMHRATSAAAEVDAAAPAWSACRLAGAGRR